MSRRMTLGGVAVLISTALMLTACSGTTGGSPGARTAAPSDGPSPLATFEAPREFEGTPVPLTLEAVDANLAGDFTSRFTLSGEHAYGVTGTSVGAVDLLTGETIWETRFPGAPEDAASGVMYDSRGPGAPVVSEDGSTVYAVMLVYVQGTGTTSDSAAAQLVAVDAETGDLTWSTDIPLGADVYGTSGQSMRVAGAQDGRVIVALDGEGMAVAVDSTTHEVLWSEPASVQLAGQDVVVVTAELAKDDDGAAYPQLAGLDPATGELLWSSGDDLRSAVMGAAAVETEAGLVMTVFPYSGADPRSDVIDPADGRAIEPVPGPPLSNPSTDGVALYDLDAGIRALDPVTLETRWELPEGNRIAPTTPVFFGGLVYGRVGNGMSVVLDGESGADLTADIPGTFVAVNQHGALMLVDDQAVFVPATG